MLNTARSFGLALRDAARSLRHGRAQVSLATAILTLAMTAATVTFAVVDPLALRALPFDAPDRLVAVALPSTRPGLLMPVSPADFLTWRGQAQSFESLAAVRGGGSLTLRLDDVTTEVATRGVTWDLFEVLGVRPVLGRTFGPEHEQPGGPRAVVLSHAFWSGRLAGDADIVGRLVMLGDEAHQVAGVLPPKVRYPMTGPAPDLYRPYVVTSEDHTNTRGFSMFVVGRLRPDVTLERARADPQVAPAVVLPLTDYVIGPAKTWLRLVLVAVALMLVIASLNVAGLFLARAIDRRQEMATREALGASRWRLATGLALEGLMVAGAAGVAAIGLAAVALPSAVALLPPGLTRTEEIGVVDVRVIVTSLLAAAASATVFAVAPAWLAAREPLSVTMKAAGGPLVGGQPRAMMAFLVGNTAVSAALLVPVILVVASLALLIRADLGFDRENVVQIDYRSSLGDLPRAQHAAAMALTRERILSLARGVRGVSSAALTSGVAPLGGARTGTRLEIPGFGRTEGFEVESHAVSPDYFNVLRIRLKRGRVLTDGDGPAAPRVMVINELAAARYFKHRDPLGQVVDFSGPVIIVGVVATVYGSGPEDEPSPAIYTSLSQSRALPGPNGEARMVGRLIVRVHEDPRRLGLLVREAIRPALSGFEPGALTLVQDSFSRLTAVRRFNAQLMIAFGVVALILAATGVYGTTAFVVGQQLPVFALLATLGANPVRILRDVLLKTGLVTATGVVTGLAISWGASSAMRRFVYGIHPADPAIYGLIGFVMLLVCIGAAFGPARRSIRTDLVGLLRRP
jgi:predicted permease